MGVTLTAVGPDGVVLTRPPSHPAATLTEVLPNSIPGCLMHLSHHISRSRCECHSVWDSRAKPVSAGAAHSEAHSVLSTAGGRRARSPRAATVGMALTSIYQKAHSRHTVHCTQADRAVACWGDDLLTTLLTAAS